MNADKMLENEGYVYSDTIINSDKKTIVSYINGQKWNRIVFILEDKIWLAESFLNCVIALDAQETKAVLKKCEEMGWIESDEKQAIKSETWETNFEHYKDEIRDAKFDFALKGGKVVPCDILSCKECHFYGNEQGCDVLELKWLYERYEKKYKLIQFEYDLINTFGRCKECCLLNEIECLKKLREKGYFEGIDPFTKVHEIIENCEVIENGK